MGAPSGLMLTAEQEHDLTVMLLVTASSALPDSLVELRRALSRRATLRSHWNKCSVEHRASCRICLGFETGGAA